MYMYILVDPTSTYNVMYIHVYVHSPTVLPVHYYIPHSLHQHMLRNSCGAGLVVDAENVLLQKANLQVIYINVLCIYMFLNER